MFVYCMKVNVFLERKNQHLEVNVEKKAMMKTLLEQMNINPVEVVVAQNGEVVTEDAVIKEGDTITIFSVISGG